MANILTVDVEDWFHILGCTGAGGRERWPALESRVERNTHRLLDLFDEAGVRATFFTVGWVAWRLPGLVRRIADRGHEVGCHSFWHELLPRYDRPALEADLSTARALLQDQSGQPVLGFRAPGSSLVPEVAWVFDLLQELGFTYDASLSTGLSSHGGFPSPFRGPHRVRWPGGALWEIPWSTVGLGQRRVPYAGGGYLRLLPYAAVRAAVALENCLGRPAVLYVHPREIDPTQPRMKLPAGRRFKYYVGLRGLETKLRRLLHALDLLPAGAWIEAHGASVAHHILDCASPPSTHRPDPAHIPPAPPLGPFATKPGA